MKAFKLITLTLLATFIFDAAMAQMIRNKAIHFSRQRVKQHHHKK